MDNLLDQSLNTPEKFRLPYEIVSRIVDIFVSQLMSYRYEEHDSGADPYLNPTSTSELLKLRLVSKVWSQATIPFAFRTLRIHRSKLKGIEVILRRWSSLVYAPDRPCPVRRLIIEDLIWLRPEDEKGVRKVWKKHRPIFINQAAKLIKLLGENLDELTLVSIDSFGFPSSLVKAIKCIKNLKRLNLDEGHELGRIRVGLYDSNSLSDFLNAIPGLECLDIQWVPFEPLELQPPALSKLRCFNFLVREVNRHTIAHICETAKATLKIIGYACDGDLRNRNQIFGPIQGTLEVLSLFAIHDVAESLINMKFPRLRILHTYCCPNPGPFDWDDTPRNFMNWTIMHTIRMLVLGIGHGLIYLKALCRDYLSPFHMTPHLKHIVFILDPKEDVPTSVPSTLVETLKSYGIQSHVRPYYKPDELMALDDELNGPMK